MNPTSSEPLRWSEEILREIFHHTPVGVVLGDLHGTIFNANDAFCAMVGYPRDLVVGRPAESFVFPEDAPRVGQFLERVSGDSSGNSRAVHRLQSRSGKPLWVSTTLSLVVSDTNEPICVIAFVEDIGERLAMENALRESEMLYRQVVENQTDMIVRYDRNGIRTFANPAYARFFGLSESELTGTSAHPLIYPPDRAGVDAAIAALTPASPSTTLMHRVVAAKGAIRWTEWSALATFDSSGTLLALQSIGRDVTEKVAADEALRTNEARYRRLFENLPIPAWETDWSGIIAYLRERGVMSTADLVDYVAAHPEQFPEAIRTTQQRAMNPAGLAVIGVPDIKAYSEWLTTGIEPSSLSAIARAVGAIVFDDQPNAQAEITIRRPDGELRTIVFRWARIRTSENDWRLINTMIDLTPQKQIERELMHRNEALGRSEHLYREIFHSVPVAMWETDWSESLAGWREDGITGSEDLLSKIGFAGLEQAASHRKVIEVNEQALDLFGARDVQTFSESTWPSIRPQYTELFARTFLRVLFGEQQQATIDVQAMKMSGEIIDQQLTLASKVAAPGRITSVAVNITERKLAERAVRESESLYRLLFHNLPVAVWDTDWSPALERWKKDGLETVDDVVAWLSDPARTREELMALRSLHEVNQNALTLAAAPDLESFWRWAAMAIRREDIPRVVPVMIAVILGQQRTADIEARVERCDGVMIDMDLQLAANEGMPGRVISVAMDVSDRKRIERELLQSQMLLERAQAIAHTGSWELSIENDEIFGSREYWNIVDGHDGGPSRRKLSTMVGYAHPDDRGAVWQTLLEERQAALERSSPGERTTEFRVVRSDGSIRHVRGQGLFARTPDGDLRGYGVMQDITEQKKAEEAAQRQREELTRADRMISLGVLVSGVAHEINNPNHLIMLNAPLLRSAWNDVIPIVDEHALHGGNLRVANLPWDEMRTEVPEIIDEIAQGAERIRAIVTELREFGRDQRAGELRLHAVNDIVRGSLRLLANHLRKATSKFSVDLGAGLPLVEANAQRLEQVIVNLVLNSCQALPGTDAAIRVATCLNPADGRVEVHVIDEGRGIAPDDLKKIRDPFFTTKRAEGGMGLGLAVSERIVQEHNGLLTFHSEPGRGTTAVLSLPVHQRG